MGPLAHHPLGHGMSCSIKPTTLCDLSDPTVSVDPNHALPNHLESSALLDLVSTTSHPARRESHWTRWLTQFCLVVALVPSDRLLHLELCARSIPAPSSSNRRGRPKPTNCASYHCTVLEVCTCGNPVLCNVFLPGSKHVAKVASFAVHLFPSGTWVEDASQERCCAISTFALVLFLEECHASKPQRRGTSETRDRAVPSHFVMSKELTVLLINRLLSSKPSCLIYDDCPAATSRCVKNIHKVRIRFKLHSPTFPVCI